MTWAVGDPHAREHRERPPRAVVGSQISRDEEMFGALFDRAVVRRFIAYVRPYRRRVFLAIAAVLVATGAQLAIPLVVRYGIDSALLGDQRNLPRLAGAVAVFAAVIVINYAATWFQDRMIAVTGEEVMFDLRHDMFAIFSDIRSRSWTRPRSAG